MKYSWYLALLGWLVRVPAALWCYFFHCWNLWIEGCWNQSGEEKSSFKNAYTYKCIRCGRLWHYTGATTDMIY